MAVLLTMKMLTPAALHVHRDKSSYSYILYYSTLVLEICIASVNSYAKRGSDEDLSSSWTHPNEYGHV